MNEAAAPHPLIFPSEAASRKAPKALARLIHFWGNPFPIDWQV